MTRPNLAWRLAQGGAVLLFAVAVVGVVPRAQAMHEPHAAAAAVAAVPQGMARLWIYREYEPYQSLATPYVRLNGAVIGVSEPGEVFYRDVPAGTYAVTVDSGGTDVDQFATVGLAPGQQVFIKVLVSNSWASGGGGNQSGGWARDTFYTWQIQPQEGEAEISTLPLYNGS
jgi:hypothetical protein